MNAEDNDLCGYYDAAFQVFDLARKLLRNKQISQVRAKNLVGQMLSTLPNSWRVVGITQNALNEFKEVDFNSRPGANPRVERAHFHHRRDVIRCMLRDDSITCWRKLLECWFTYDATVLCLTNENNNIAQLEYYEIVQGEQPLFRNMPTSYAFSAGHEGRFLQELHEKVESRKLESRKFGGDSSIFAAPQLLACPPPPSPL